MYVPKRLRHNTIRDWKGHGAVPSATVMTIQSYDCTRAVPQMTVMNIISYNGTREVLRQTYDLAIKLG